MAQAARHRFIISYIRQVVYPPGVCSGSGSSPALSCGAVTVPQVVRCPCQQDRGGTLFIPFLSAGRPYAVLKSFQALLAGPRRYAACVRETNR